MPIKGAGRLRGGSSRVPSMRDARAKGSGGGAGLSQQELYFQLSAASAEEARLRAQLDQLRVKERRALARLETIAQNMTRLQNEVASRAATTEGQHGKQPKERGYGPLAWEVTELRY
jgi:hypothetical protein